MHDIAIGGGTLALRATREGYTFASPLAQGGYYEAEVGKPLRVEWRVSDGLDAGVDGLASQVVSFGATACPAGSPTAVGGYEASQTTSVQALGNGGYWRTLQAPASYAGTCKQVRVGGSGDGAVRTFVVRYIAPSI